MPVVRIDITGPKDPAYRRALLAGARAAITSAFGVPDERVMLRVVETPAQDVDIRSPRTDRATFLDVLMKAGRTPELKEALVAAVREAYATDPGIAETDVAVSFRDAEPEDLHL